MENTSLLDFSKYNQVARDLSSIKVIKYLKPFLDLTGALPQTSECTNSKHVEVLCMMRER
jgi:hypothetical protein